MGSSKLAMLSVLSTKTRELTLQPLYQRTISAVLAMILVNMFIIIIIVMFIYHMLINALSAHIIHSKLNMFYIHM